MDASPGEKKYMQITQLHPYSCCFSVGSNCLLGRYPTHHQLKHDDEETIQKKPTMWPNVGLLIKCKPKKKPVKIHCDNSLPCAWWVITTPISIELPLSMIFQIQTEKKKAKMKHSMIGTFFCLFINYILFSGE